MIPNIVHFIYFDSPCARRFSYMNALAVKTAYHMQNPKQIIIHYNTEQKDNPHWESIKPYVTLRQIDAPTDYKGIPLQYVQYQADITRLQILQEFGGIYMDTDQLLIRPLNDLLDNECVMGGESYIDHARDLHDVTKIKSLSSGLIMSAPYSRFIEKWVDRWPEGFKDNVWASHAVVLPWEIAQEFPNDVKLLEVEAFTPFDFRDDYIFGTDLNQLKRLKHSYGVHMWDTIWQPQIEKIDEDYLRNSESLFSYLFRRYA